MLNDNLSTSFGNVLDRMEQAQTRSARKKSLSSCPVAFSSEESRTVNTPFNAAHLPSFDLQHITPLSEHEPGQTAIPLNFWDTASPFEMRDTYLNNSAPFKLPVSQLLTEHLKFSTPPASLTASAELDVLPEPRVKLPSIMPSTDAEKEKHSIPTSPNVMSLNTLRTKCTTPEGEVFVFGELCGKGREATGTTLSTEKVDGSVDTTIPHSGRWSAAGNDTPLIGSLLSLGEFLDLVPMSDD